VADNGIGLPPGQRERVFDMFVGLHRAGELGGGSGMGLSIARRIVEMHGGHIWVEDAAGGGTTMVFTLGEVA
jgi:signal transduction histidine kinase